MSALSYRRAGVAMAIMIMSVAAIGLAGCSPSPSASRPADTPAPSSIPAPSSTTAPSATTSPTSPATSVRPSPSGGSESTGPTPRSPRPERVDPRWRFFTEDRSRYRSDWFDGAHRIMIPFGCTRAPYYSPDPRCDDDRGFHHGVDVAMPCGTPIRAGRAGTVVDPSRPGSPGSAYGKKAFRLRVVTDDGPADVLIGHARAVKVRPGEHVRRGEIIAEAGDLGAPDGCHLHVEQRAADGGLSTATNPRRLLALHS